MDMHIGLNEEELLRVERIVIDGDKEEALAFVKGVLKKKIDRHNVSGMKRERV